MPFRLKCMIPALLPLLLCCPPAAAGPCWEAENIKPLEILFWNTPQKLCGYQNMEHLWSSNTVARNGAPVKPLIYGKGPDLKNSTMAFMQKNGVYGLLVMHKGAVIQEHYRGGCGGYDGGRWTSFSMAKSLTGLLVGAAVADGHIRSLDDRVAAYLPELAKGAYAEVTVRQLLTMTSGVAWNENYRDPASDVAKLADLADGAEHSFLAYMAARPRKAEPGTVFTYSTGEAGVIGHLVRRATGKSLAAYMSEKIWSKLGMERDAVWITDRSGAEVSGCCFSATLRDYARMGRFMLEGGVIDGKAVLPPGWMRETATASKPSRAQNRPYGYQMWVRENGAYQASGIFGQLIHVDPERELVIVMLSAWENAVGTVEQHQDRRAYIAAVKKALAARGGK
ncbi:Beta-lactamase [uncultured delta proteobacterium]|uniref:Beta-lactamase n=1 Tax=uncultured delta proteobacterium TaxID=34034 RepID=A0A212KDF7_9DELT|nr:Beta-lactamase [uncultured delta proteobacterium]